MPAMAMAARGYATVDLNLRAGPGIGYPIITTIPDGRRITIYGCLGGHEWCEVSFRGFRGWASADYLNYFYRGGYVHLPRYVQVINVPVVTFALDVYWDRHYRDRPFFHRKAHWVRYWHRHADRRQERREDRADRREDRREERADRRDERRESRAERRRENAAERRR